MNRNFRDKELHKVALNGYVNNGMILDEVQKKLLYDVATKCLRENREDYDEVFKEVMDERIKQYNLALENMQTIIQSVENLI